MQLKVNALKDAVEIHCLLLFNILFLFRFLKASVFQEIKYFSSDH